MRALCIGVLFAATSLPACTCDKETPKAQATSVGSSVETPPRTEDRTPLVDLPALAHAPADAELVAHVDLRRLLASPLWRENQALMTGDPEARRTLEALSKCKLALDSFSTLDLAVDSQGQRVMVSLQGDGIGDTSRLQCIGDTLFSGDSERWEVITADSGAKIRLDGGAAVGHVAAADRLVFATKAWDSAVHERIAGGGESPGFGTLGETLGSLDTDRAIWFAGRLPMLAGQAENLRSLSGAIDLDTGLALELGMVAATPELAAEISKELDRRLGNIRTRLAKAELPEAAADRIEVKVEGSTVRVRAALEIAEITAIRQLLAQPGAAAAGSASETEPSADAP